MHKREHYRKVYDQFDPAKVARYDEAKQAALLADTGIVRNPLKVAAALINAQAFLKVQEEYGSFDDYIWQFVDGVTLHNRWLSLSEIPVRTERSDAMSKDLKKRGFKFASSTICYAFMQATGMVNEHEVSCFRYAQLVNK